MAAPGSRAADEPTAGRLRAVRERVEQACARSGRDPGAVRLVAVSKTVDVGRLREAVACGQRTFGENRVQEALEKIPELGAGIAWHLVGHLQRNKARHAVGRFELIHGLDGEPLARELATRAERAGIRQAVLLQVNLSREDTKSGVEEPDVQHLAEIVAGSPALELRGLMTIPPPVEEAERSRPWFARLRELRERLAARLGTPLPELSMGMTDDFEVAIEEGATLVRVGRAIFGERS